MFEILFIVGCLTIIPLVLSHWITKRPIAINVALTPLETSRGTESLDSDVAVTFKNALVTKTGATDDRHFKLCTLVTDIPYGILQNDEVASDEPGVIKKSISLFGLYHESLPAVAAAAIAANDRLVADLATPGRVKTIPATTGTYLVIGRSRFAVAAAGDPVSIIHNVAREVAVP